MGTFLANCAPHKELLLQNKIYQALEYNFTAKFGHENKGPIDSTPSITN
jgi:hypothetical protein